MSFTRTDITTELQDTVETDRHKWKAMAWDRAINAALIALSKDRPYLQTDTVTLVDGQSLYPVPTDFIAYSGTDWGLSLSGARPRVVSALKGPALGKCLRFIPCPSSDVIADAGASFEYRYHCLHVLTDTETSLTDAEHDLLITRSMAALMRDLITANVTDPVQMHRGMGSVPNQASPRVAFNALMNHYRELTGAYQHTDHG